MGLDYQLLLAEIRAIRKEIESSIDESASTATCSSNTGCNSASTAPDALLDAEQKLVIPLPRSSESSCLGSVPESDLACPEQLAVDAAATEYSSASSSPASRPPPQSPVPTSLGAPRGQPSLFGFPDRGSQVLRLHRRIHDRGVLLRAHFGCDDRDVLIRDHFGRDGRGVLLRTYLGFADRSVLLRAHLGFADHGVFLRARLSFADRSVPLLVGLPEPARAISCGQDREEGRRRRLEPAGVLLLRALMSSSIAERSCSAPWIQFQTERSDRFLSGLLPCYYCAETVAAAAAADDDFGPCPY
ncbi:unnamed protein product [Miscanthus lutarioriparius]|uniref:Uncharacterized protein n=1 Tax=Miscanthus lutarioriparius TaxID=422564 RepID=A0A811S3M4_9POAL|nr:unnamed protein product [Miscanthus lutarioriparius]